MEGVKLVFAVFKGTEYNAVINYFEQIGIENVLTKSCRGTSKKNALDILSLEYLDRNIFFSVIPEKKVNELKEGMIKEFNINANGVGMCAILPVDSFCGEWSKMYFLGDQEIKKEKKTMSKKTNLVLIITIIDAGYTDKVMDSARNAGASGGTVSKANGTGKDIAQFFNITISEEKELVYIVASREERDGIMQAIMKDCGPKSDAHGVVFALPVESVLGIRKYEPLNN